MKKISQFWLVGVFLATILSSCSSHEDNLLILQECSLQERVSNEVTLDEARTELETLLVDVYGGESRAGHRRVIESAFSQTITSAPLSRSEDSVQIVTHVFNFADEQGFAIMSGDIRLPSLIALAESGSLSPNDTIKNPGLDIFLSYLPSYLIDDVGHDKFKPLEPEEPGPPAPTTRTVYGEWQNIVYKQNGYCPVKWGQKEPYNKYCPLRKNGKHSDTGCVATAVAQLMSVYKHPSSYNGYNFDWDVMTYIPSPYSNVSPGVDDIARLMEQLGLKANLNVSYGTDATDGSSAKSENIARTLKAFGYSNSGTLGNYKEQTAVDELKKGFPILMSGCSKRTQNKIIGIIPNGYTYSGSHQWLVHGLLERKREIREETLSGTLVNSRVETQWYLLCNWGWHEAGSYEEYDGYYLSGVFNASEKAVFPDDEPTSRSEAEGDTPGNYKYQIKAITGIRK